MTDSRPWHKMYEQLGASPEVKMLQLLEPEEFDDDEIWATQLRQQFPTVPPSGVEMCHKNWLVGLDMLLECIGNEEYQRENYWCGDVPIETVMELGLRRRILQFWLKGLTEDEAQEIFADNSGETPNLVRVFFAILGDVNKASFEIKQDVQNVVDILVGPFVKASEALSAKWKILHQQQIQRESILQNLDSSVITSLCNYYTPKNIDALIRMIARQQYNPGLVGGCNNSLKFLMEDKPQIILGSTAIVWACYLFVAADLGNKTVNPPDVVKDMALSALEKLGNCNPLKLWLTASLGLLVKAWVKRAWAFMNVEGKRDKLPNFIFDLHSPKQKNKKNIKAPKLNTSEIPTEAEAEAVSESDPFKFDGEKFSSTGNTDIVEEKFDSSDLLPADSTGAVSLEELEKLVEQEDEIHSENTITGAMTSRYALSQKILESESLRTLENTDEENVENEHNEEESEIVEKKLNDPLHVKIKKPESFGETQNDKNADTETESETKSANSEAQE